MPIVAGLLGGISGSFVRGFTVCLNEHNGLTSLYTWLYFTLLMATALVQLRSLNKAIHLYDQIEIVPIYQASLILLNMLCGSVIMKESSDYTNQDFLFLLFCLIICISGVFIVQKRPKMRCIKENRLTNAPQQNFKNEDLNEKLTNYTDVEIAVDEDE
jgi:hypothetical protein